MQLQIIMKAKLIEACKKFLSMKKYQKFFLPVLFFFMIIETQCTANKTPNATQQTTDGVITGADQRACPCCGGLMINFTGETKPYTGTFYLVENNLSSFGITDSSSFPLLVKASYIILEKCSGKYVSVSNISRR